MGKKAVPPRRPRRSTGAGPVRTRAAARPSEPRVRVASPEYGALRAFLNPLMDGRKLERVDDRELDALADVQGRPREVVRVLAQAARLSRETGLPEEALFALARDGRIPDAAILAVERPAELKTKLGEAARDRRVSADLVEGFESLLPALRRLHADRAPLTRVADVVQLELPAGLKRILENNG